MGRQETPTQQVIKVKLLFDSDENSPTFQFVTQEEFIQFESIAYKPGNCHYGGGFGTTGKCCPEYKKDDILYVFWNKGAYVDVNIDGRKLIKGVSSCTEVCGTVERGNYTIAGIKGSKGDMGLGTKGADGEKGNEGETPSPGDKGSPGEKGPANAKGQKGADGEKGDGGDGGAPGIDGENVDIGHSAIVRLDGQNYGARLMGVCVNGSWKYVYVFASEPSD